MQYYIPSLLGTVSGSASIIEQFEGLEVTDRLLIPLEGRIFMKSFNQFSLALGFISSPYIQNTVFGSMNLSVGAGLYHTDNNTLKLTGLHIFLYPMYDIPVYSEGKTPLVDWKAAFDLGYAFCSEKLPIYLNVYERNILYWRDSEWNFAFDLGVSVGFYFSIPE
jgi:hypothetical protein